MNTFINASMFVAVPTPVDSHQTRRVAPPRTRIVFFILWMVRFFSTHKFGKSSEIHKGTGIYSYQEKSHTFSYKMPGVRGSTHTLMINFKSLGLGFNRLVHKRKKVKCPRGCGAIVRRDGLASHYRTRVPKIVPAQNI